jgi:hypothetical protein
LERQQKEQARADAKRARQLAAAKGGQGPSTDPEDEADAAGVGIKSLQI